MSLFKTKKSTPKPKSNAIEEKIHQRRRQMLVHSYIYYDLGETLVPDSKWQQWADELVELQLKYPEEADKAPYSKEFRDFDGTTGYNLPYRVNNIVQKGNQLMDYRKENNK